jgi:hypothetical protein
MKDQSNFMLCTIAVRGLVLTCMLDKKYVQFCHGRGRTVRVDRAALLHEVAHSRCAPEDDHLLAERLDVDDVPVLIVPRAVRVPCLLLREVEQVADKWERPRAGGKRQRAALATPDYEKDKGSDDGRGGSDIPGHHGGVCEMEVGGGLEGGGWGAWSGLPALL